MSSGRSRSGGKLDRKHRKPVEQILPETFRAHCAFQIDIRRRHHANISLDHFIAADTRELSVLQHAQQTHLRRQTHLANFVEKQRAAIRFFKPSATQRARISKRAFLVTKQFRLEQRLRNRAAV